MLTDGNYATFDYLNEIIPALHPHYRTHSYLGAPQYNRRLLHLADTIDCIKEIDVTSVTSPIGLWTAARKTIVLNLGSAILKISGACWEK